MKRLSIKKGKTNNGKGSTSNKNIQKHHSTIWLLVVGIQKITKHINK